MPLSVDLCCVGALSTAGACISNSEFKLRMSMLTQLTPKQTFKIFCAGKLMVLIYFGELFRKRGKELSLERWIEFNELDNNMVKD